MTVVEHTPLPEDILDLVDDAIRQLRADGGEAKYILVGKQSYETLRTAISSRFRRESGLFETYNFIPIVVDPFRENTVCVVPSPREVAAGIHAVRAPRD